MQTFHATYCEEKTDDYEQNGLFYYVSHCS